MYMTNSECHACHGARLKPEILSIKVGDKNINELTQMSIRYIKEYLNNLELNDTEKMIKMQKNITNLLHLAKSFDFSN